MRKVAAAIWCGMAFLGGMASGQNDLPLTQDLSINMISPLDSTREMKAPVLESATHTPLTEEYVWTANSAKADGKIVYTFPGLMERTEVHYFRAGFNVGPVPKVATLYLAGPRRVRVWVNGQMAEQVESDTTSPLGMHVFAQDVARFLRTGRNTIAIEAVRGRGVTGFTNSELLRQLTFGQVVVGKILAAPRGVDGPVLMRSGKDWKSSLTGAAGWEAAKFDDSGWAAVQSIGGIESSIEMYQWNADAGLYDWPGYDGISGFLAHARLPAKKILSSYAGRGTLANVGSLTGDSGEFAVKMPAAMLTDASAPSVVLDFGREITGRVELVSDADVPVTVTVQMGESESETMKAPYLGVNQLEIPPHGTGHGPKTAFRYARVVFLAGAAETKFKAIQVDHIYYPVKYAGSFESSDPLLNRIWEVGAYTAHLCMQDGVWDASKRDRGRWMGDTDVSGRVIEDVFGEKPLMEDTLDRLMGPEPESGAIDEHVNGIPGYSSFWFTETADFYRHTGDKVFLEKVHQRMIELLNFVDREFDQRNVYANKSKVWLYVDWSPEPERRYAGDATGHNARVLPRVSRSDIYAAGAWRHGERGQVREAGGGDQDRCGEVPDGGWHVWTTLGDECRSGDWRSGGPTRLWDDLDQGSVAGWQWAGDVRDDRRPDHLAVLQLLRDSSDGGGWTSARGAEVDQDLLGRDVERRRDELLGGVRPELVQGGFPRIAAGG